MNLSIMILLATIVTRTCGIIGIVWMVRGPDQKRARLKVNLIKRGPSQESGLTMRSLNVGLEVISGDYLHLS